MEHLAGGPFSIDPHASYSTFVPPEKSLSPFKRSPFDERPQPRAQTVKLAVRIARHTRYGWDDPHAQAALHDDAADVARLLTLSQEAATRLIMAMDS